MLLHLQYRYPAASQPIRAAWIEIAALGGRRCAFWSQPIRAAWIEIIDISDAELALAGRSPFGLRGLKFFVCLIPQDVKGRSPFGLRGLK